MARVARPGQASQRTNQVTVLRARPGAAPPGQPRPEPSDTLLCARAQEAVAREAETAQRARAAAEQGEELRRARAEAGSLRAALAAAEARAARLQRELGESRFTQRRAEAPARAGGPPDSVGVHPTPPARAPAPRPPTPLRTNRTRRVLHPVLIGHAASFTPC